MDTDFADRFGAVKLEKALIQLASSKLAYESLEKSINGDAGHALAEKFRKINSTSTIEDQIYNFFVGEIEYASKLVWEGDIFEPEAVEEYQHWPIAVHEYEGIFYVAVPDYENSGYFLSLDDAKNYAFSNWDGVRELEPD